MAAGRRHPQINAHPPRSQVASKSVGSRKNCVGMCYLS
jgi:hypothetical protein